MALITCQECGKEISDKADKCPNCGSPIPYKSETPIKAEVSTHKGFWSAGRLSIGIISIILFVLVSFQSCAAGLSNALEENKSTSGSSGFAFSLFILIAGIVGICTRNSKGKVGTFITTALYWFATICTIGTGDTYPDLPIWGGIAFVFGAVFLFCGIKTKKA
ncbi:MAG: hypothetical protein K0R92_415 [Lachnospiraceae bacterium]|nr:hypothetical protein [Lachnospiraceae bacterium]